MQITKRRFYFDSLLGMVIRNGAFVRRNMVYAVSGILHEGDDTVQSTRLLVHVKLMMESIQL